MIRLSALRWIVAGFALELDWLFACEAWREREPVKLALFVLLLGPLLAAAWHAFVEPRDARRASLGALGLAGALIVADITLELLSPYPRRFAFAGWELARAAALLAGFTAAAKLTAWRESSMARATAWALCGGSLVLALLVAGVIVYIAIDGGRDDTEPADAALVLGFALADDGTARPQLVGRMEHASELVKQGTVRRLVLSGGVAKAGHTEAAVMRDLALAAGVPADAIVLDEASRSTIENFACSRPMLERLGAKRVLLVTEPWHMTRAMLLARRHGIDPAASPASSAIWRDARHAGYWLFRDAIAYVRERARDPFADLGQCRAATCEGCRTF